MNASVAASLERHLIDGPTEPRRLFTAHCEDCREPWETAGVASLETVDLDDPVCPECGGNPAEVWA